MKKILSVFAVVLMLLLSTSTAFAHPVVPEQSIGKVNVNAANGMHTAWANVQNANGIAEHVFLMRHSPH
jgi:methionine-rich copper-binding protein CopC